MHLEVIDVDKDLAREVAHLKAAKKLPYGDCFAAALTKMRKATLITSDRAFKAVESDIEIEWV